MKAPRRHPLNDLLVLFGVICLVVLSLPLLAAGAFILRAAFLFLLPVALVAGITLWFTSARFRSWIRSMGAIRSYKGLRLASDVAVDRGHAWMRTVGRDVTIGADDLVATTLGPLDKVELPTQGRAVWRGDPLFQLRRGRRVIDVRAPVSGTIAACNSALSRDPGLVNEDPFRRGWAVRMRTEPDALAAGDLRSGPDAFAWYRTEVDRTLMAISGGGGAAVPAMPDGGLVSADLYKRIDDATWEQLRNMWEGARS